MVKAKDFWNYLCGKLEYRVFSGVPCLGLDPLYKKMDVGIMHYIPAVKENIALGVLSGAGLAGFRGGLLMSVDSFSSIMEWLESFSFTYKIPVLIIMSYKTKDDLKLFNKVNQIYRLPTAELTGDFEKVLSRVTKKIEKNTIPGIVFVKEGLIS